MSQKHKHRTQNVVPLLAALAVRREGGPEIPGYYCEANSVWMVEVDGERTPIISVLTDLSDLVTKTMSQMESDDETRPRPRVAGGRPSMPFEGLTEQLLELATKTATRQEADDR
jgi:hypothetical protein